MMFRTLVALAAALLACPGWAAEVEDVQKLVDAYAEAFNRHDAEAITQMWQEDGTHLDRATGQRTAGREAILADLQAAWKQFPKLQLAAKVQHAKAVTNDVLQVAGETVLTVPGDEPETGDFTAILVRSEESWRIASMEESGAPETQSSREALQSLAWLVGKWVDQSDDLKVETHVRWSEGEAFLLRTFVVETKDVTQHGTQVIGWDPRSQQIRSWSFNSDGSFGDGTWSQHGDEWLVKSSATSTDGMAISGTYVINRVDDDTMEVQLVGHEIEGEPQPASPKVTVVRVHDAEEGTPAPAKTPAQATSERPAPENTAPEKTAPEKTAPKKTAPEKTNPSKVPPKSKPQPR